MELKIYKGKEVEKTYFTDSYDLKFGTIEDVANAVNLDDVQTGSNDEIFKLCVKLVLTSLDTVKDLLKDIFDGITDEEIRRSTVNEMAIVLVEVVAYTMKQLNLNSRGN